MRDGLLLQHETARFHDRQKRCAGSDSLIRASIRPHFRPRVVVSLLFLTAFFVAEKAVADPAKRLERMLSWSERVGIELDGTKEVSTKIDRCEFEMRTEYSFPDLEPIAVKRKILTIDLRRVGRIEQSVFRDLYLVELYAHGFGSILRPIEKMKARTYWEREDGEKFDAVQDLTLNLFIPTLGRETVGSDLRDYVEAYCSKGI